MTEERQQDTSPAPEDEGGASYVAREIDPVDSASGFDQRPVEQRRESVRGSVTGWLIAIFIFVLGFGIIAVFVGGEAWMRYEDFLRFALPAVTGLLGTAIGFYFGSQR